jgi:hypothetical protein
MESASSASVLVVAHKTAATPALIAAVRERAAAGPASFTLLVPNPAAGLQKAAGAEDAGSGDAERVIEQAVPLLSEAAGSPVEGRVGDANPLDAVADAVNLGSYDEIIISTLPVKVSRWLKLDLPSKVGGLGLPVTTVTAQDDEAPVSA